jgi:hypothetical protein
MQARRLNVFFYGLFMDEALLHAQGFSPANPRRAMRSDLSPQAGRGDGPPPHFSTTTSLICITGAMSV